MKSLANILAKYFLNKMNMIKPQPTIRDIARETGLSLGTVSQALRNKPGVAPETRAQVIETADKLGYRSKTRVVEQDTTPLTTVGMLVKQDSDLPYAINPFYSHVMAGVERECRRQGIGLMFASVEVDEHNRVIKWPLILFDKRVDGLIVVGTFLEDAITQIGSRAGDVIVLVDAYAPGRHFDSIVTDNVNGALAAVHYLIENGHTRIGLVGSAPDSYPSIRERRKGYTRALKQYGIDTSYIEDGPLSREGGYTMTKRLLRRAPEITAIFACNDNVAIGAMNAAQDLGRRIPDDLSIVGFDDIDLSQEITPPLTTVHVDKMLMGVIGVRQLRDRVENSERTSLTTVLSTQLIVRKSVRSLTSPISKERKGHGR
jgi:LacI family transcriptional regulator